MSLPNYPRSSRPVAITGGLVLLTALIAACGSSKPAATSSAVAAKSSGTKATKTVAFSHPASDVPYVIGLQNEVVKVGRSKGLKVLIDHANDNLQTQVGDAQSWVTQKVAAIDILPLDAGSFAPLQKKAQAQNTCWQTYTSPMPGSNGTIGWSPAAGGTLIGQNVVSWINANDPTAQVLVLTASTYPAFATRTSIPIEMIKTKTKATVVAEQDALTEAQGLTVTKAALQQHPKISVVVAFNDDGAIGAAQAFKDAGKVAKDTWVGGQDGSQEGLQALLTSSYIKADVAIPLQTMANAIINGMTSCISGKKVTDISVPQVLVTQSDPTEVHTLLDAFAK